MSEFNEERRHASLAELDAAVSKGMRDIGYDAYEKETRRIAKAAFAELKPLLSGASTPAGNKTPNYAIAEGHDAETLARNVNKMLKQGYRLMDTPPFTFKRLVIDRYDVLLGREMIK